MSKLTSLIKQIVRESYQLNEIGGGLGGAPKPQAPSPAQQRSNYTNSVMSARASGMNATDRGSMVNSMGPSAGSAGVSTVARPPTPPVMGSTANVGVPGSRLAQKATALQPKPAPTPAPAPVASKPAIPPIQASSVPSRIPSAPVNNRPTTAPKPAASVTVNPVQNTPSTVNANAPELKKPSPTPAPKATIPNKPAISKRPTQKIAPKAKPASKWGYGSGSGNQSSGSLVNRALGGVNEEAPQQVKESFEKFLRNNFLKG